MLIFATVLALFALVGETCALVVAAKVASPAGDRTDFDLPSSGLLRRAVPPDVASSMALVTFYRLYSLVFLGAVSREVSTLPTAETLVASRASGLVCRGSGCR